MTADDLKTWRIRLKLSQAELAEILKVAPNTVSRWESSTRKIPEFLALAMETVERRVKR